MFKLPKIVSSPCIQDCHLQADGLCRGCLRTGAEIASWPWIGNPQREALMAQLPQRRVNSGSARDQDDPFSQPT